MSGSCQVVAAWSEWWRRVDAPCRAAFRVGDSVNASRSFRIPFDCRSAELKMEEA